jgi:soluble lytic murein transglycosylase-like protein
MESLKAALALVGLAVLAALAALVAPPIRADSVPPDLSSPAAAVDPVHAPMGASLEREQRAVTEYIAKRYRVAYTAIAGFVATAYRAGEQHSVDPLLILAVMAVESRYNPVAQSTVGAQGLMQVIPRFHLEKLIDHGGEHALLEPEVNIEVGARILREYQRRFGDTETALQMYAGALDEPTTRYASKVFAEKARLESLTR